MLMVGGLGRAAPRPADVMSPEAEMNVLPVPLTMVTGLSSLRVNLPEDLRNAQSRESTLLTLQVIPSILRSLL